ncbi:hypothetical protein DFJ77DRAFT_509147 [Powellomyces hirtus]|nr:hypothetical protein DFJ77DRAFT_509147 [Powellomyces hirtus]
MSYIAPMDVQLLQSGATTLASVSSPLAIASAESLVEHEQAGSNSLYEEPSGDEQPVSTTAPIPAVGTPCDIDDSVLGLDDISRWTADELRDGRLLVKATVTSSKGARVCTFARVAQRDMANATVVSCIRWAEKNECYITSVDCIYLLEYILDVRLRVDEKNRIRRNLESLGPKTISKALSFFTQIMSYKDPKPRNIEKDVKVFPWKVLQRGLRKIIEKMT